ncbi:hypothetical protein RCZ15_03400 [Capnocytophaga catalasegens]|uniref:HEAT repeat domain-containing protein n=1 Tax=Capnocytophaga catalasegens TaxID=1004260 RepID=A0AAV5ASY2_9FLAO|nr:hypothetical protein RCZ03_09860 [Capnocytophaga catalasegens]GJM49365.1 hypothetical protein RCZ15_03400 [Capnocytophaga catalasegens]GJM52516.1 hypothetical protein RCZ16_08330 [Capnocytophaga catalasegens]
MTDIIAYIQYYLDKIGLYPSSLGEIFIFNLLFLLLFIFNFIFLVLKWHKRRKTAKRKLYLRKEYAERITQILLTKRDLDKTEMSDYLAMNAVDGNYKELLTNLLLEILDQYKVINRSNYKMLLERLKLKKYWEDKLQYGSKKIRDRALRKIGGLNMEISESILIPITTVKDSILRKRARSLYLYISKNNPFKFFDEDFDSQFSQWDSIEIHSILQKKPRNTIPNFIQWVQEHSISDGLKSFLVYEIAHYHQKDSLDNLLKMLEGSEVKLRQSIIDAFGVFGYQKAIPVLSAMYNTQPSSIQQAILRAFGNFKREDELSFIQNAIETAHDMDTRLQGLESLYNYGKRGREIFYFLKEKAQNEQELLPFLHIEHPLNQKKN